MNMGRIIIAVLVLVLVGCSPLQPVYKPDPAFNQFEPLDTEAPEIGELPRLPRPTEIRRVDACLPEWAQDIPEIESLLEGVEIRYAEGCSIWSLEGVEGAAYSAEQLKTVLLVASLLPEIEVASQALSDALTAREQEINAYLRLGRLVEMQQNIMVQQAEYYRREHRTEWWSARIAVLLALFGVAW